MLSAVALDPGTARYSEVGKRQLGGFEAAALAKEPNRTRVMHDRVELLGHLSDVDVRPSSDVGGGWWSGAGVHERGRPTFARPLGDARPAAPLERLAFAAPPVCKRGPEAAARVTLSLAGGVTGKRQNVRLAAPAAKAASRALRKVRPGRSTPQLPRFPQRVAPERVRSY